MLTTSSYSLHANDVVLQVEIVESKVSCNLEGKV